jgi:hypothetical protein
MIALPELKRTRRLSLYVSIRSGVKTKLATGQTAAVVFLAFLQYLLVEIFYLQRAAPEDEADP